MHLSVLSHLMWYDLVISQRVSNCSPITPSCPVTCYIFPEGLIKWKIKKTPSCAFLWETWTSHPPWGRLTGRVQIKNQSDRRCWRDGKVIHKSHFTLQRSDITAAVHINVKLCSCIYIHGFYLSLLWYYLLPAAHTESSVIIVAVTSTTTTKKPRSDSVIKDE